MPGVKTDVYALKPLNGMGHILAIMPKIPPEDVQLLKHLKFQLYPTVMIFVYILIYGLSTYGKSIYLSDNLESTVYILNVAQDITMLATTVISIVGVNIINGYNVLKLLRLLKSIDDEFKDVVIEDKKHFNNFCVEFCLVNLYCFIYYSYSMYFWMNFVGFGIFKFFCMAYLFTYHMFALSLIIRHYALAIKYRYEKVNWLLKRLPRKYDDSSVDITMKGWGVKRLACVYTKLFKCVAKYNSVFGMHFVTLYIYIVINFLAPINIALIYGTGKRDIAGITFGGGLIVLCLIWTSSPLILGSGIFSACDECTTEAAQTPAVCYSVIQQLSDTDKDLTLKHDLRNFAQQARCEQAIFSASGFFNINLSVLFTLFGSVTSYLIVLIQFH